MKKNIDLSIKFLTILFLLFNIVSCSEVDGTSDSKYFTIKDKISEIDESVSWSRELEGSILENSYSDVDGMDSKVDRTPYSYLMKKSPKKDPVYPYVSDFTSLDVSSYPDSAFTLINSFCKNLISGESLESYFDESTLYDLAIFIYDYEKLLSNGKKYNDYLIGEPFISDLDDIFQCPVRIYEDSGNGISSFSRDSLDLSLYLTYKNNSYKIQEIRFIDKNM